MEEEDKNKGDEILKLLQAQTKISVNFPLFARLAQKPMLGNKEAASILSVSVRQMYTLRTSRGLGFF